MCNICNARALKILSHFNADKILISKTNPFLWVIFFPVFLFFGSITHHFSYKLRRHQFHFGIRTRVLLTLLDAPEAAAPLFLSHHFSPRAFHLSAQLKESNCSRSCVDISRGLQFREAWFRDSICLQTAPVSC